MASQYEWQYGAVMTTAAPRRRQRGEGTIYVHKRDANGKPIRYAGQVELGWDTEGRRRRKTIYGHSHNEVVRKMQALRRQLHEHGDLPTSDVTLETWLKKWLREIAVDRLKPNTLRSYKTAVHKHIIPAIGRQRLSTLSAQHIRQMHRAITGRGLSSTTALNAHRILAAALNDAIREGYTPRNVATLVRAPAKAVSKRQGLTAEEAVKVLRVAASQRLGSTWLFAFLLGVRQGERLALRWSHLDLTVGAADVSWGLQRVTYDHGCMPRDADPTCGKKRGASCPKRKLSIPEGMEYEVLKGNLVLMRPKTDDSRRMVALIEPLRLALLHRQAAVDGERASYTEDHDLVWCEENGAPIDPRDDWECWHQLLEEAGVRPVAQHEIRHSTATLLLELGVDPRVVQELLGHSKMVTTHIYQHVSLTLQRQALDELGARLELTH